MLAKREAARVKEQSSSSPQPPQLATLRASGIEGRSPATVSAGLRSASKGSPPDQNQAGQAGCGPGCAPHLTQYCIAKYLVPLSKSLTEVPARPTISELPDAVIDHMVTKDKAFWVDKPGLNDYTIHDAYNQYGIFPDVVRPIPQNVFPRSYQYDLDCVRYRRSTACDGLKDTDGKPKKPLSAHCRDCRKLHIPPLTPFQLAWAKDTGQKRWRYYPDLTATLTREEIRASMDK
ncbi:unnamed protein product [Spodoptera exigua]|nr:unnamed protein product [Spodoptera exigua]